MKQTPVVFLDKDGTLVKDVPYNVDPVKIILEQGVAPGLRRLARAGCGLVVVSNQSGVARGFFREDALGAVITRINEMLENSCGARLDGFYYCPHHPQGIVPEYSLECSCRKPQPGLLLAAARELDIDLSQAWMVGDILDDVEAGNRAGCRTILIDTGHESLWTTGPFRTPDFTAGGMEEAADIILSCAGAPPRQRSQETRSL